MFKKTKPHKNRNLFYWKVGLKINKQCILVSHEGLNLTNFLILYCNEYIGTAKITSMIFWFHKQWTVFLRIWRICKVWFLVEHCTTKARSHWSFAVSSDDFMRLSFPSKWDAGDVGTSRIKIKIPNTNEVRIARCYLQFTQYLILGHVPFFISIASVKRIENWTKLSHWKGVLININGLISVILW